MTRAFVVYVRPMLEYAYPIIMAPLLTYRYKAFQDPQRMV